MKKTPISQNPTVKPPRGLQNQPVPSAGVRTKAARTATVRKANAAAGRKSPAAAEKPHQFSAEYLPEVWRHLGLNPDDYAGLPPALANALLPISTKVGYFAWPPLWKFAQEHGIEAKLPALCADFYDKLKWVLQGEEETLAVFEDMAYNTITGQHFGTVELVRIGSRNGISPGRLGMRAVKRNAALDRWDVIDPWDRGTQESQDDFPTQP
jgi:hypothetical protein